MWSPQSDRLCYELSRWSQFGSQKQIYIYDIRTGEEKVINNTTKKISQVFWDKDGKVLYYFNSQLKDASTPRKVYAVDVFKISLEKLEPEADVSFFYQDDAPVPDPVVKPYVESPSAQKVQARNKNSWVAPSKPKDANKTGFVWINRLKEVEKETAPSLMTEGFKDELSFIPVDRLETYGIHLYLDGIKYSFVRNQSYEDWISDSGSFIGIDDSDYLYFVKDKWFKKRMFKVEREYDPQINHQYAGGKLVVDQMRWLTGSKYVLMNHKDWGVLLLDPYHGKIGVLIRAQDPLVGWGPA
jgi:hypothetical protein